MIATTLLPRQVVPLEAGPIWTFVDSNRGCGKTFSGAYAMAQRLELGLDVDLIGFSRSFVMDLMGCELSKIMRRDCRRVGGQFPEMSFEGIDGAARLWVPEQAASYHHRQVGRIIGGAWFDEALNGGGFIQEEHIIQMLDTARRMCRSPYSRIVWTGYVTYPGDNHA